VFATFEPNIVTEAIENERYMATCVQFSSTPPPAMLRQRDNHMSCKRRWCICWHALVREDIVTAHNNMAAKWGEWTPTRSTCGNPVPDSGPTDSAYRLHTMGNHHAADYSNKSHYTSISETVNLWSGHSRMDSEVPNRRML
jgi:hypothetical protein